MTTIPGVPAYSVDIAGVLQLYVNSTVKYTLLANGNPVAMQQYAVQPRNYIKQRPVVLAFDYEILSDPTLIDETFGLAPRGWAVQAQTPHTILILALDNNNISSSNIEFRYAVNNGTWQSSAIVKDTTLLSPIEDFLSFLQSVINQINGWLGTNFTLSAPEIPIFVGSAQIPGQQQGSYVSYYANVTDSDGNRFTSPCGFYFVVNKGAPTRILITDPNFYLYVAQSNLQHYLNFINSSISYTIPGNVTAHFENLKRIGDMVKKYAYVAFRHWEYLGAYNFYIARVNASLKDILDTFSPDVIILANIWNGIRDMSSPGGEFWDWDLRDIRVNNTTMDKEIINYVKQHHAGLIGTHGTLSDWIVWKDTTEKYKICPRGHVGYSASEIGLEEQTLAHMFGLPLLPLWEEIRDAIASALCADPLTYAAGIALGSTPLQVPYVPFNGTMHTTPDAEYLNWSIPDSFYITMPGIYSELNFTRKNLTAHTQTGWQLSMPMALAYLAWSHASDIRNWSGEIYKNLSLLLANLTGNCTDTMLRERVIETLNWVLHNLFASISMGQIYNNTLAVSMNINGSVQRFVNFSKQLGAEIIRIIHEFIPIRLAALSEDGLAGIITNDKYWDEHGFRSVYFSFEVEIVNATISKTLLCNAVNWCTQWKYNNITQMLGGILRVDNETYSRFMNILTNTSGNLTDTVPMVLNEEGISYLNLTGVCTHTLLIAHPTSGNLSVFFVDGTGSIEGIEEMGNNITRVVVKSSGSVSLGFSAHCRWNINPAYVCIKTTETPVGEHLAGICAITASMAVIALERRKKR